MAETEMYMLLLLLISNTTTMRRFPSQVIAYEDHTVMQSSNVESQVGIHVEPH